MTDAGLTDKMTAMLDRRGGSAIRPYRDRWPSVTLSYSVVGLCWGAPHHVSSHEWVRGVHR